MRCSSCGHENLPGRRFCAECGAALAAPCAACGTPNEPGAKFCGGCGERLRGTAAAVPGATTSVLATSLPAGERRQLTVVFCDLVGSTPLSQRLDAEEWRDVIAQYQTAAASAVARWGGYVAKNLGDGLLIYFGWPNAHEDDPERAVRAGLAIVEAVDSLVVSSLPEHVSSFPATSKAETDNLSVRIGIHTGPVVIADGGEIFGETANIAARVQNAAEPDTVVVTAATQRLVAGMFLIEDRGPQALKGVREPVTLYRVVQQSGARSRFNVAAGRLTRFVGREIELATLVDRWERAQDGDGQNVLVVGEAGVGKSRLVYQLRDRLAAVPHTWLECGATPYTEGTPFYPVIALMTHGLAFALEDTAAGKLGKVERGLGTLASAETVALLADFVGLPPPAPLPMGSDLQRRKTIDLLMQWILTNGSAQPLVVFVEDLHWCDASSLELLGHLVAQTPTARVLLIATARPEFTSPWPARSNLTTLQLARLSKRQAREMVANVVSAPLPDEMVEALIARADGVPLYVEELTKAVVEPGVARGVEAIPATLADSLMSRLDRLSTAKEVAQRAAVLGREFSFKLLAAVAGLEEAALRHGLARLVEAEIVFARGEPPQATYIFKHAMVQEAAYASLLKRTRQQLHSRVVTALIERFPERSAAEPEVVARHAEMAGKIDDAITYYRRAGEHAQARSAHEEAIRHLRQAIVLVVTSPEHTQRDERELPLQLALGSSLIAVRGWAHDETGAAWERALRLCESVEDTSQRVRALTGLASVYQNAGEIDRALELAERIIHISEQTQDETHRFVGHSTIAGPLHFRGHFASSLAHCEHTSAIYETSRHAALALQYGTDPGMHTLCLAAWNLWQLGFPDRALDRARESVRLARSLHHPFSLAYALQFETAGHWLRRDCEHQQVVAEEVIALSETQGFPLWLGLGRAFRAGARLAAVPAAEAVTEILQGLALAARTGQLLGSPLMMALLGEANLKAGQHTHALRTVETGIAVSARTGQRFFDAELHRLKGEILLASRDDRPEPAPNHAERSCIEAESIAEECFRQALEIAGAQQARSFELRAATSLARYRRDRSKRAEARDLLTPLYAWFTEGLDTADLFAARQLLEELE